MVNKINCLEQKLHPIELKSMTAAERQQLLEELCALPEPEFRELLEMKIKEKQEEERFAGAPSHGCWCCRDLILLLVDVNGQKVSETGDGTITDVVITDGFVEGRFCPMCGRKIPFSAAARNPAQ